MIELPLTMAEKSEIAGPIDMAMTSQNLVGSCETRRTATAPRYKVAKQYQRISHAQKEAEEVRLWRGFLPWRGLLLVVAEVAVPLKVTAPPTLNMLDIVLCDTQLAFSTWFVYVCRTCDAT